MKGAGGQSTGSHDLWKMRTRLRRETQEPGATAAGLGLFSPRVMAFLTGLEFRARFPLNES